MSKDTGIKALKGAYGPEDPPLPIPNREVKLRSADGTAPRGGRVGRRRIPGVPVTTKVAGTFFYSDCDMMKKKITDLFRESFGVLPERMEELPASGSARK